jgi:hypothetical protein
MSKWDVPQKEGFSIFYAFQKLDYLLRDRRFTLKTDHENLTRLKENYGPNKKVQRWLLAFQHYDYEHIPGRLNIVADAFRRLCIRWQALTIFSLNVEETNSDNYKSFADVHNDLLGHNGYEVTKARLKQQGKQWQGMNKHIKKYLKSCPCCQKQNYTKNTAVTFPFTVSSLKPGEKIQIDFITGLTPDDYGVTSILVVIDCMSRWVELYNLTSLSAETTVDCLLAYCSRFGVPKTINMDKDPVLKADIMTQLMSALGTNIIYNLAYSKEENAIVERANKEVLRHIRNFIFGRGAIKSYSRYTPLTSRIMNSSKHQSTGFTPAQIIYGDSVDLNRMTVLQDSYLTSNDISYSDYIRELKEHQNWIIAEATKSLTEKDEVHMINYPSNQTSFEVDTYVLAEYTNVFRRGPTSKLLPFLKGPLKIVAKQENKYTLLDLTSGKLKNYHKTIVRISFRPKNMGSRKSRCP